MLLVNTIIQNLYKAQETARFVETTSTLQKCTAYARTDTEVNYGY